MADKDRHGMGEKGQSSAVALLQSIDRDMTRLLREPIAPGLYLIATPIGNLADITLRALSILARADIVYCEDTRHSAKLLQHFSIHALTKPFHDHNEEAEQRRILEHVQAGKAVAVISDAGTPLVSDPGFKLVREASAEGYPVIAVPGPSAVLAALTASGLPTDAFYFAGFLPPRVAARRAKLAALSDIPGSLVFFESPQRAAEALADMADVLGDRSAVMARELTKLHEEFSRGRLADLAKAAGLRDLKGEIVVVVGPSETPAITDDEIQARLKDALQSMSLKDAAKALSDALGVPKTRIYDLGLKAKNDSR